MKDTKEEKRGTGRETGDGVAGNGPRPPPTVSMPRFLGHPESPSDPTIDQWLADFDVFGEREVVLVDYIGGCAKEEVLHVTRKRFIGTSGPWCLCCGECLGRGRP